MKNYSVIDMFDSEKRKEIYRYYDDNYEESQEEKDIFESWRKKRLNKK